MNDDIKLRILPALATPGKWLVASVRTGQTLYEDGFGGDGKILLFDPY